jgi:hypothetical protein
VFRNRIPKPLDTGRTSPRSVESHNRSRVRLSVLISVPPAGNWPYWPTPYLPGDLLPIADLITRESVFTKRLVDFFRRGAVCFIFLEDSLQLFTSYQTRDQNLVEPSIQSVIERLLLDISLSGISRASTTMCFIVAFMFFTSFPWVENPWRFRVEILTPR